jgi:PleD family two-component response regulator
VAALDDGSRDLQTSEQLVQRADHALYKAKQSGRDRTFVDSSEGAGLIAPALG